MVVALAAPLRVRVTPLASAAGLMVPEMLNLVTGGVPPLPPLLLEPPERPLQPAVNRQKMNKAPSPSPLARNVTRFPEKVRIFNN